MKKLLLSSIIVLGACGIASAQTDAKALLLLLFHKKLQ
jgi:hypothetical protein